MNIILNLEDPDFMVLLQMHDKILAIAVEVNVNQIDGVSIIRLFLDVYLFYHAYLGKVHVSFQKSNGEAIDVLLKNVGEVVFCWWLRAIQKMGLHFVIFAFWENIIDQLEFVFWVSLVVNCLLHV